MCFGTLMSRVQSQRKTSSYVIISLVVVWFPAGAKDFSHIASGQAMGLNGYRAFLPWRWKSLSVKLATQLHSTQKLGICAAIPTSLHVVPIKKNRLLHNLPREYLRPEPLKNRPIWPQNTKLKKSCFKKDGTVLFDVIIREKALQCTCFLFNPLNAELNPIRHLPALVGARRIVHVSRVRVKSVPFTSRSMFLCSYSIKDPFCYPNNVLSMAG